MTPKQAFLAAGAAVLTTAAVVQAPVVAPRLTATVESAVELVAAGVPVDLATADVDAAAAQPELPDIFDFASPDGTVALPSLLDGATVAPTAIDDGGVSLADVTGLSAVLSDLSEQTANPAAWLDIDIDLSQLLSWPLHIVEGIAQFAWDVVTWPIEVVEHLVDSIL